MVPADSPYQTMSDLVDAFALLLRHDVVVGNIKEAMAMAGMLEPEFRLPMCRMSDANREMLVSLVGDLSSQRPDGSSCTCRRHARCRSTILLPLDGDATMRVRPKTSVAALTGITSPVGATGVICPA